MRVFGFTSTANLQLWRPALALTLAAATSTSAHAQSPDYRPEIKKMQCQLASGYSNYIMVTPVFDRDPNRDINPDWRANFERLFKEDPSLLSKLGKLGNVKVNFKQWGAMCQLQTQAWPEIKIGQREDSPGPPGDFAVWHDIAERFPNWRVLLEANPKNLATATQPVQPIGITVGGTRDKPVSRPAAAPASKSKTVSGAPSTTASPAKRKAPSGPCGGRGQRYCRANPG